MVFGGMRQSEPDERKESRDTDCRLMGNEQLNVDDWFLDGATTTGPHVCAGQ